jgi:hypothetical protein
VNLLGKSAIYSPELSIGAESFLSWFAVAFGANPLLRYDALAEDMMRAVEHRRPLRLSIRWSLRQTYNPLCSFMAF